MPVKSWRCVSTMATAALQAGHDWLSSLSLVWMRWSFSFAPVAGRWSSSSQESERDLKTSPAGMIGSWKGGLQLFVDNSLVVFMGLNWIKLSSDQMELCFISKGVQILCEVMSSKIEFSVAALHLDYYNILYHKNRNLLIGRQYSSGITCHWLFYNRFLAVHKKSVMF